MRGLYPNRSLQLASKSRPLRRNRRERSDQHETLAKVWKLTNVRKIARNSTKPRPPRNESFCSVEVERKNLDPERQTRIKIISIEPNHYSILEASILASVIPGLTCEAK
ncbi:unnamed protein product [Sphenostylis stenocarpa]|uniref:Uncharacterized protein n=1 Tax=Sphenostylis stenocarpa TaxID=92480 RepID=A0AA86TIX3_9FABA|nr:unnamed protein product [Sphenostylis stenocarpa]